MVQALPFETIPTGPLQSHFADWLNHSFNAPEPPQASAATTVRAEAAGNASLTTDGTNPGRESPQNVAAASIAAMSPLADAMSAALVPPPETPPPQAEPARPEPLREPRGQAGPTPRVARGKAPSDAEQQVEVASRQAQKVPPAEPAPQSEAKPRSVQPKSGQIRSSAGWSPVDPAPEAEVPVRRRPQFVAQGDTTVWVTKPLLRSRGWTEGGIRAFLPEAEALKPNPRYAISGSPMQVWRAATVAAAERRPEWREWLERSLHRRGTTLEELTNTADPTFRLRIDAVAAAIEAADPDPPTTPTSPDHPEPKEVSSMQR
ncbi:hypothetical protein AB0B28_16090 [Glycomyces sp. NPDC046736]|uniref:hypothetical protein n=1 Tax=Glycomyces sp. NPDC046736 TaxID=3155615 RepID=UPI0033DFCE93